MAKPFGADFSRPFHRFDRKNLYLASSCQTICGVAKLSFKEPENLRRAWDEYAKASNNRFMVYSYAFLILVIYELLLSVSRTPYVVEYDGVDLWFKAMHLVRGGTAVFSLLAGSYLAMWLLGDWFGIKVPAERYRDRQAAKADPFFKPKPKGKFRPNWYYFGLQAVEGLTYGTAIYLLLQVAVWLLLLIPFSELPIYKPLDASPSLIHHLTNPVQDVALAFGAGFYEEVLFRYLLFWGILTLAGKFKPFQRLGAKGMPAPHLPGVIPAYNLQDNAFVWAMATGSVIYAFSHYVYYFGDLFSLYSFFYRFFFGFIMYYIFVKRHIGIAMFAHVVHDFWYFLFR